jgi:hypothetical protein
VQSEPGPPMTLGNLPLPKSGLSCGARRASIRSGRTQQRWLLGTAPAPASSIGARSLSVLAAADGRPIWL